MWSSAKSHMNLKSRRAPGGNYSQIYSHVAYILFMSRLKTTQLTSKPMESSRNEANMLSKMPQYWWGDSVQKDHLCAQQRLEVFTHRTGSTRDAEAILVTITAESRGRNPRPHRLQSRAFLLSLSPSVLSPSPPPSLYSPPLIHAHVSGWSAAKNNISIPDFRRGVGWGREARRRFVCLQKVIWWCFVAFLE